MRQLQFGVCCGCNLRCVLVATGCVTGDKSGCGPRAQVCAVCVVWAGPGVCRDGAGCGTRAQVCVRVRFARRPGCIQYKKCTQAQYIHTTNCNSVCVVVATYVVFWLQQGVSQGIANIYTHARTHTRTRLHMHTHTRAHTHTRLQTRVGAFSVENAPRCPVTVLYPYQTPGKASKY
jgi:hypothetical protein